MFAKTMNLNKVCVLILSKMKKQIFQGWELKLIVVAGVFLLCAIIFELLNFSTLEKYPMFWAIMTRLAGAAIATVLVLIIQRLHKRSELEKYFKKISGSYIRIDIAQDNVEKSPLAQESPNEILHPSNFDSEYLDIHFQQNNVGLSIDFEYTGGYQFLIEAEYFYNMDGKVHATIDFSKANKSVGTGRYLHVQGRFKGHFGTFTIYQLPDDHDKLLVLYQHIHPREISWNPDENKGWEIWIKQDKIKVKYPTPPNSPQQSASPAPPASPSPGDPSYIYQS